MPYGISKSIGGDSPSNVKKMEECVKKMKKKNPDYDEAKCIKICKSGILKANKLSNGK